MARRRAAWRWLAGGLLAWATPAEAQLAGNFGGLPSPFISSSIEAWAGAEATRHAWSTYSGINWSPFGQLGEDGLRVRLAGGYGEYRYAAPIAGQPMSIYGTAAFADLLVGYQMALGRLTIKAFAGASFDGHLLDPFDAANSVSGAATGVKGVLESWLNLGPSAWAQLDLAAASAHETYSSRMRLGWRATGTISLGLEAGSFGNVASRSARAGAFARYEWPGGEISLSGGVTGDIAAPRTPYGTVVYMSRF